MTTPCVIFDSHHPRDYLVIRETGRRCLEHGIKVVWTARRKDVLVDLIEGDGFVPAVLTESASGLVGKLFELGRYDWRLAVMARRHRAAALIGKSVAIAQVGWLLRIPSILINDDSAVGNPQFKYLGYPFASRIITPAWLQENHGRRHQTFQGFFHLAYLHPKVFAPSPSVRDELGVSPQERIFVIRLAAFQAYHDVGGRGIGGPLLHRLVERLGQSGRVFISSEAPLANPLKAYEMPLAPSKLHHVLAASALVVGDGLSVCIEAALLGVPAIVVGSYVPKHVRFDSLGVLENRFKLAFGFTPDQEEAILAKVNDLADDPAVTKEWQRRRGIALSECMDPTMLFWDELCKTVGLRNSIPIP